MRAIKPEEFMEHFLSRVEKLGSDPGCWIWTGGETSKGYGALRYLGKPMTAHRVSFLLHRGAYPSHLNVLHVCDIPLCVRPDHLWLGTQLENIKDRDCKMRTARGEGNARSLLTEDIVRQMRLDFESGVTRAEISRAFGHDFKTVHAVVNRLSWKHVP